MAILPENLTTFAPNRMPLTGYFDAEILEVAKNNLQALVAGAIGDNLTADLTVTEGHKHDNDAHRLLWRQLASFPLLNNCSPTFPPFGTAPDEVFDSVAIDDNSDLDLAVLCLLVTAADAAVLIPRVKVSNDNSATTDCNITLSFYETDCTTLVATQTITISTATARDRVWVDGSAIDCSGGAADVDLPSHVPLVVFVTGALDADTEDVALHEIAFGVTP